MRENPDYALTDEQSVRDLVRAHPFGTLVSAPPTGLVASHYPVIIDDDAPGLTLISHVGRPDEVRHELGHHDVLLVVQGPHGYISPGWYGDREVPAVPTWNYVVAHLHGRPEILTPHENRHWLTRLVDHFEAPMPEPRRVAGGADGAYADRIVAGTVGFRLVVTHVEAKAKLSQDKPSSVRDAVVAGLEGSGPYADPGLAGAMRATARVVTAPRRPGAGER